MLEVFYQPYPEKFKVPESDARSVLPAIPREIKGAGKRCSKCSTRHIPRNSRCRKAMLGVFYQPYPEKFIRNRVYRPTCNNTAQLAPIRDTEQNPNVGGENQSWSTWYWRLRVSSKSDGGYKDIVVQLRLKLVVDSSETKIFGNGKNLPLASKILCKNKQTNPDLKIYLEDLNTVSTSLST